MSNEKIEVTTKGGVKFLLNPSITYGQNQELVNVYLEEGLNKKQVMERADKMGVEFVVHSINGSTEKIYEAFKGLSYPDALEIMPKIKAILDPKVEGPVVTSTEKKA